MAWSLPSWNWFPADVQRLIVTYLPQPTILAMRLWDKSTCTLIDAHLTTLSIYDFSSARNLHVFLTRKSCKLSELYLCGYETAPLDILKDVGNRLTSLILLESLRLAAVFTIFEYCSSLRNLYMKIETRGEDLNLSPQLLFPLSVRSLSISFEPRMDLVALFLGNLSRCSQIQRLTLKGMLLPDSLLHKLLPQLTHLELDDSNTQAKYTFSEIGGPGICSGLDYLRSDLPTFITHAANLRVLHIFCLASGTVLRALQCATNLEALFLDGLWGFKTMFFDDLEQLMRCVTKLESLSLPTIHPDDDDDNRYYMSSFQAAWKSICNLKALRSLLSASLPISQADLEYLLLLPRLERWQVICCEDAGYVPGLFRLLALKQDTAYPEFEFSPSVFINKPLMSADLLWYILTQAEIVLSDAGHIFTKQDNCLYPIMRDRNNMIQFLVHYWSSLPANWKNDERIASYIASAKISLTELDRSLLQEIEDYDENLDSDYEPSDSDD